MRETGDREALLLGLVENVAREQLTPVEEARAYALLVDEFELGLGEIADQVGRSKPSVSNRMRLLDLPEDVLAMLERGELTEGHARAVLAVPDHEDRRRLAREIVRRGLSVRGSGARCPLGRSPPQARRARAPVDPVLADRARSAAERLTGRSGRVRRGRLEIAFADDVELAELVEALEAPSALSRNLRARTFVGALMLELWQQDIEWLEAISQDEDARALFLRMAALSQSGRLEPFLTELRRDDELDDQTKGTVAELAGDRRSCSRSRTTSAQRPPLVRRRCRLCRLGHDVLGENLGFGQTPSTGAAGGLDITFEMGDRGFEPRTSALSERRSNQLS